MTRNLLQIFSLILSLQLSCSESGASTTSPTIQTRIENQKPTYTLQYQRWGYLGFYHVGIKISMNSDSSAQTNWYINGSGETSYVLDTIFTYQIPAIFPVFMRGYIHPKHPTASILNIRKWENIGEEIPISQSTAIQLIAFAQNGMANLKSNKYMYSPVIAPFQIGSAGFYTSNSFVATMVHWINENGGSIGFPVDGNYVGFDGPFIPRPVFEAKCK